LEHGVDPVKENSCIIELYSLMCCDFLFSIFLWITVMHLCSFCNRCTINSQMTMMMMTMMMICLAF